MILFLPLTALLLLATFAAARLITRRLRERSTPALIGLSLVFFLLVFQAGRLTLGA